MKLYLIRHGESTLNVKEVHQDGKVPLSAEGKVQATRIGKRLKKIHIDRVISSPFERARQTAEIIGKNIGKEVLFSNFFTEMKRPTAIEGKFKNDAKIVEIKEKIMNNWENPHWHHSDEENFFELRNRAISAIHYLVELNSENIIVVTHGEFMRIMICVMIFGNDLQPREFKFIRKFLDLSNTGITLCKFDNGVWKLKVWNDHAHLKNALSFEYKN